MVFAKEKLITAVDISDGLVKIAAVSAEKGGRDLHTLDSAELPTDKEKEVAKEVRSLISKNKLGKSLILVSFPRHLVTVRNVRLPTAKEEEVKNMAELQAVKYVPYSQEEMVVAHKVISVTKEGYTDILLILAQRKSVNRYVEIFRHAGIPIEKLTLSSEGILNWYSGLDIKKTDVVAIIDLDSYHTHIQIVENKKLLFSRSVSFNITDPASDRDVLLREIKLSFDSYLKEKDEKISRVILSGSEDYARDFSFFLSDNLSTPCDYIDQFQGFTLKKGESKYLPQFKKASYVHLLGIASQPEKLTINLLPRDIIDKRKEQILRNELIRTMVLSLFVVVIAFGIMEKKISEKRSYLKKIETRLKEIEPEIKELLKLKENIGLIRGQLAFKGSSISIIREVYDILPEDVTLTLFEFEDKNRILLRGTTKELSRVFNLLPQLEGSPYFENVKINYATKRTFKRIEFADFEIICALR